MPNPQNVEPYGQLCHECAEAGGPEAYKNLIASIYEEKGRQKGIEEAREQDFGTFLFALLALKGIEFGWTYRYEIKDFLIRTGNKIQHKGQELKEWAIFQRKRLIQ